MNAEIASRGSERFGVFEACAFNDAEPVRIGREDVRREVADDDLMRCEGGEHSFARFGDKCSDLFSFHDSSRAGRDNRTMDAASVESICGGRA